MSDQKLDIFGDKEAWDKFHLMKDVQSLREENSYHISLIGDLKTVLKGKEDDLINLSGENAKLKAEKDILFKSAEYWRKEAMEFKRLLYEAADSLDNLGYFSDCGETQDSARIYDLYKKYPNEINTEKP